MAAPYDGFSFEELRWAIYNDGASRRGDVPASGLQEKGEERFSCDPPVEDETGHF